MMKRSDRSVLLIDRIPHAGVDLGNVLAAGEHVDADAATNIPAQPFDGASKNALVVCELLQRAHLTTCADDGDEIVWLNLLRNELPQLLPDLAHALKLKARDRLPPARLFDVDRRALSVQAERRRSFSHCS